MYKLKRVHDGRCLLPTKPVVNPASAAMTKPLNFRPAGLFLDQPVWGRVLIPSIDAQWHVR